MRNDISTSETVNENFQQYLQQEPPKIQNIKLPTLYVNVIAFFFFFQFTQKKDFNEDI